MEASSRSSAGGMARHQITLYPNESNYLSYMNQDSRLPEMKRYVMYLIEIIEDYTVRQEKHRSFP
jgi:hypothetical protein